MKLREKKWLLANFTVAADPELRHMRKTARQQMQVFNNELDGAKRSEILKTLFGKTGNGIYMEPNFYCDYGSNIHVRRGFLC